MRIRRICRRLLSVIMLIAVLFTGVLTDEIKNVYADTYNEGGEDISGEDVSNEGASNEDISEEDTADKDTTDEDTTSDLDETWNESDEPGLNEDGTIYTVDLTNWVISDRKGMTLEYMDDGSAVIMWSEEAREYASVSFKFESMDFTGWTCVVDAEGDIGMFGVYDAVRRDILHGNLLAATINFNQSYPFRIELDETVISSVPDKDGIRADYKNIGSVDFAKGIEMVQKTLIVHSIKFYKDRYEAPVFVVDPESKPQGGSDYNAPGMNEEGTIFTVDLKKASGNGPEINYRADGSVAITWHEYSGNFSNVEFPFKRIDVAGWTCVLDGTGDKNIFIIADAYKRDQSGYGSLCALVHYGQHYPAAIKCDDWELGDRVDEYGDPANFNEIGKVIVQKGEETRDMNMVINSIKFYKNSEDVPKFIKAKMERPLETPKPTSTPTPTPKPTKTPRPTGVPTSTPAWQATKEPGISPEPSTTVLPNMNPTQSPTQASTQAPMEDTQTSEDMYRRSLRVKGFRISSKDNRSILITWKRNAGAASYRIYRSVKKNGAYRLIKTVGGRKTSYTDKKAGYPKKYYYKIAAAGTYKGSNIQGPDSNICSIFLSGIITPSISVQKGSIGRIKYVTVNLKKYEGDYIDIYTALDRKKFKKLKLVSRSIARYKGKFKIQYIVKNKIIRIKVKTFKKIGKKNRYSMYSNTVSIKV